MSVKSPIIKDGTASVLVPVADYGLETVKFAAYALTGDAYARLEKTQDGVVVELRLKRPGSRAELQRLAKRFKEALPLESIRSEIEAGNRGIREEIIRRAVQGDAGAPVPSDEPGLSPEQEAELDRLIREVETELGKESAKAQDDPLGVNRTWEEQHGSDKAGGPPEDHR